MGFSHSQTVSMDGLIRSFAIQEVPQIMLFLGAGASVSAGIPTADDMVWMFKREIYCSRTGTSPDAFRDLSIERHRAHLQNYFDKDGNFPTLGAESEYSDYFERCYQDEQGRRTFIRRSIRDGKPTIGHECLAVLLAQHKCEWIWTTNFDDLLERAERTDSPERLSHVGPESGTRIETILRERLAPVLVKLHGDYRYDRLQNTKHELLELDRRLRDHLEQNTQDNGLIVIGYSGRDESVMSALEAAVCKGNFRRGIYWCAREETTPSERVRALVSETVSRHGNGGIVEVTGFDDFLFRLYRQCAAKDDQIDGKAKVLFDSRQTFHLSSDHKSTDPLKTNAIKVVEFPTTPFTFNADVTSWKELRQLTQDQEIIAGLLKGKVHAFGNQERIRSVFQAKLKGTIEPGSIHGEDLRFSDSVMLGLLYDVLEWSLQHDYGLIQAGWRENRLFYIPVKKPLDSDRFEFTFRNKQYSIPLAEERKGVIVNEALGVQLDYHEDALWLVLVPRVVITTDGKTLAEKEKRRLANTVLSARFNDKSHERLLFWLHYLMKKSSPITFAFPSVHAPACKIILDTNFAYSFRRPLDACYAS
jgi:NAD-dependent SIR2 family protein deacetylase